MRAICCTVLLLFLCCATVQAETGDPGFLGAETTAGKTYQSIVEPALEALKAHWKADYLRGKETAGHSGYLEIKNTRIIWIRDDIAASGDQRAAEVFGDIDCFIEFMLLSDYYGSEPHYSNAGLYDCVIVQRDGTMTVSHDPLNHYRSRSYNPDFSGIILREADLGAQYNAAYRLLTK